MLIRRIDHPIIATRDRRPWVAAFKRVLGVEPMHSLEGDERGFSNAEIAIGDGFVGVVEPAGEASPLLRTIKAQGEGYYGLSLDVGDLDAAAARFTDRGVGFRQVKGAHVDSLLWPAPKATGGVLFQITPGMPIVQGANPRLRGITEVVLAVKDAAAAAEALQNAFGFEAAPPVRSEDLGYRGFRLAIDNPPFQEALIVAEPVDPGGPLALHLRAKGESLFQFTIGVSDLVREASRLTAGKVAFATPTEDLSPARIWIAPDEMLGVRIELRQL